MKVLLHINRDCVLGVAGEYVHWPCIVVESTNHSPAQIVFFGICGRGYKILRLPRRVLELSDDAAFEIVRWKTRRYLGRFAGKCPIWGGSVTGFVYSKTPESNYRFPVEAGGKVERTSFPLVLSAVVEVRS